MLLPSRKFVTLVRQPQGAHQLVWGTRGALQLQAAQPLPRPWCQLLARPSPSSHHQLTVQVQLDVGQACYMSTWGSCWNSVGPAAGRG